MLWVGHLIQVYLDSHDVGVVVGGDAGVITERKPDTVRGPDVAFYSFERLPKGEDPIKYPSVRPELVVEVKSPDDRWKNIQKKVAEYLEADVLLVCVLDPATFTAQLYRADEPVRVFGPDEEVTFAPVLPDLNLLVRRLFNR